MYTTLHFEGDILFCQTFFFKSIFFSIFMKVFPLTFLLFSIYVRTSVQWPGPEYHLSEVCKSVQSRVAVFTLNWRVSFPLFSIATPAVVIPQCQPDRLAFTRQQWPPLMSKTNKKRNCNCRKPSERQA